MRPSYFEFSPQAPRQRGAFLNDCIFHSPAGDLVIEAPGDLGLGNFEEAFVWMERAVNERDPMMVPIKSYEFFEPIRNTTRFSALLRSMNLADNVVPGEPAAQAVIA